MKAQITRVARTEHVRDHGPAAAGSVTSGQQVRTNKCVVLASSSLFVSPLLKVLTVHKVFSSSVSGVNCVRSLQVDGLR